MNLELQHQLGMLNININPLMISVCLVEREMLTLFIFTHNDSKDMDKDGSKTLDPLDISLVLFTLECCLKNASHMNYQL